MNQIFRDDSFFLVAISCIKILKTRPSFIVDRSRLWIRNVKMELHEKLRNNHGIKPNTVLMGGRKVFERKCRKISRFVFISKWNHNWTVKVLIVAQNWLTTCLSTNEIIRWQHLRERIQYTIRSPNPKNFSYRNEDNGQ